MTDYLYTYACHEDEADLCAMELRALFGQEAGPGVLKSPIGIDPGRSPFIKERIEVLYEGTSVEELAGFAAGLELGDATFKVRALKRNDLPPSEKPSFERLHDIEREIGSRIRGRADVRHPDRVFGVAAFGGRWHFGPYAKSSALWHRHLRKPRAYSIALPTRLARAVANIAVPDPAGVKAIDPCCGIGTVLVEALSMGISIAGRDINPLAVQGARANLAHFGFAGQVTLGSIAEIEERYDAAVVDLPYNHVSRISPEERREIVEHARRIADRAVFLSIEPIDDLLAGAGFAVIDRCVAKKGSSFSRHVLLCR